MCILCNSNILQQKQRTAKQRTFTSLQIAPLNIQCHMTFTLVSPLHCDSFSSRACSCADIYLRTANSFKPPAAVPRSEAKRRRLGLVLAKFVKFFRIFVQNLPKKTCYFSSKSQQKAMKMIKFCKTSPKRRLSASLRGAAAGGLKEFAVRR